MERYLEKFRGFIKTAEAALSTGEYQDLLSEISKECADRKEYIDFSQADAGGHVQLRFC